jgi:hypothetical protein
VTRGGSGSDRGIIDSSPNLVPSAASNNKITGKIAEHILTLGDKQGIEKVEN